jgi:hypothetical protein
MRDIAEEKDACSQSEDAIAETEFTGHADRGVGYAGAVKVVGDVQGKKKRQQSQGSMVACAVREPNRCRHKCL